MKFNALLKFFLRAHGTRPVIVVLCLVLAAFSEAIGLAGLLPLVGVLADSSSATESFAARMLSDIFAIGDIALDPTSLIAFVVIAIVVKQLLTMLAMFYVGGTVAAVATQLRSELIRNLLRVRWSFLVKMPAGRMANALSSEAQRASRAYRSMAELLSLTFQTLAYVVVALIVSWELALVALAISSVTGLCVYQLVRVSRKAGKKQNAQTRSLVIVIGDTISNFKPLRAMAREMAYSTSFDRKIDRLRRSLAKILYSQYAMASSQEIIVVTCLGLGLIFYLSQSTVPIEELIVMAIVIQRLIQNGSKLQRQYQKVMELHGPYVQLNQFIAELQAQREPLNGKQAVTLSESCRFHEVQFQFGDKPVLAGIDMSIPFPGLSVITGASGSGKSTLVDLLLGIYQPTAGEITIDGTPLREVDMQAWRKQVGYVPQEITLFNESIAANLAFGDASIGEEECWKALELAGCAEFVRAMPQGLASVVGERGSALSGGQRQRIALARALVAQPRLLILDEVTSALDRENEDAMVRTLKTLSQSVAVVSITHRFGMVDQADQVLELANGRVRQLKPAGDASAA